MTKGFYFSHLFNKKGNHGLIMQHLPEITFYNPNSMAMGPAKTNNRTFFLDWYHIHQNDTFDLDEELVKYCRSDVDILRRCCLKFRNLFMDITSDDCEDGIDLYATCITVASACNLVFRKKYLQPDTIRIIPAHGYRPEDKQSKKALQWIKYMSKTKNVYIQHSKNMGEKRIGPYKIDGYYEDNNGQQVLLKYHGCFWHGCPRCYSRQTVH